MTCPDCGGDGTVMGEKDGRPWEFDCLRCDGTGELEPAGESVAARAARERAMQGGPWPRGDEAGE